MDTSLCVSGEGGGILCAKDAARRYQRSHWNHGAHAKVSYVHVRDYVTQFDNLSSLPRLSLSLSLLTPQECHCCCHNGCFTNLSLICTATMHNSQVGPQSIAILTVLFKSTIYISLSLSLSLSLSRSLSLPPSPSPTGCQQVYLGGLSRTRSDCSAVSLC